MISLADLPASVLGQIVAAPSYSFLIIPLLQCGDTRLTTKLVSNVDSITLKDKRQVTRSRFPKCLFLFPKLQHLVLSLVRAHLASSDDELYAYLALLAKANLKSLTIESNSSLDAFFGPVDESDPLVPVHRFPFQSLTSLHISERDGQEWSLAHYQSLPASLTKLTSLDFEYTDELAQVPIMGALPRSLVEWNVRIYNSSGAVSEELPPFWQNPPPNLAYIRGLQLSGPELGYLADYLPRSLTNVDIYGLHCDPPCFVPGLPEGIRDINAGGCDYSDLILYASDPGGWSENWGERASQFSISDMYDTATEEGILKIIQDTPASITDLQLGINVDLIANAISPSLWPAGLTTLELLLFTSNESIMKAIPSTLTSLLLSIKGDFTIVDTLPAGLTSLQFRAQDAESLTIHQPLPKSLEQFAVYNPLGPNTVNLKVPNLPASLTELTLYNVKLCKNQANESLSLPPNLESIRLTEWPFADLVQIPSTVEDLEASVVLPEANDEVKALHQVWQSLPKRLTSLRLSAIKASSISWSGLVFPSLPHLEELDLESVGAFDPSVLSSLPRSLSIVHLTLTHLHDEHIPHLNPNWDTAKLVLLDDDYSKISEHCPMAMPEQVLGNWIHE